MKVILALYMLKIWVWKILQLLKNLQLLQKSTQKLFLITSRDAGQILEAKSVIWSH